MNDLKDAIKKGTKAWADVSNASEWVEELRGNVDAVNMSEKRVHKTDKSIHEWVGLTDQEIWDIGVDNQRKGGGFWGYPRALETKLKEKNGG